MYLCIKYHYVTLCIMYAFTIYTKPTTSNKKNIKVLSIYRIDKGET